MRRELERDSSQTLNQRSVLGMQYSISEVMALTVELPFILRAHSHIDEGRNVSFNLRGLEWGGCRSFG